MKCIDFTLKINNAALSSAWPRTFSFLQTNEEHASDQLHSVRNIQSIIPHVLLMTHNACSGPQNISSKQKIKNVIKYHGFLNQPLAHNKPLLPEMMNNGLIKE